jgi:phosphoserine phosphatase RsbU/P
MEHTELGPIRDQLQARRERLRALMPNLPAPAALAEFLREIDAALERIDAGVFGVCETCHEGIEPERLLADPLSRNCLEHLSLAEQRALERDLDLAYQIQSGLLPKPECRIEDWSLAYRYESAGPVSGDYCDLIAREDDAPLFIVGDVAGKGVAASMLMAQLYAIFRSLVPVTRSPGELLAKANRVFCEGTLASHFATVVCGRIGRNGVVDISNAGHCPPLHVGERGIRAIEPDGLPLGLFGGTEYGAQRLTLGPGESLVLYTDGLTEAFNTAGEQYGTTRLCERLAPNRALPPEELLAALLADLTDFRAGARPSDDLTLMVLRREA